MNTKEHIEKLTIEKKEIAYRIVALANELYFGKLQAHDLVREQLEAMDRYYQALEARIHDLRDQGIDIHTEKVKTPSGKTVTQYSIAI